MKRSKTSRTSCGSVLVTPGILTDDLRTDRHLIRIAVDRAGLGELLLGEAALVGARAAAQVLDAGDLGEDLSRVEQRTESAADRRRQRSEEHTSELQSPCN